MSIIVWNVRGLNKERRQDLKEHIASFAPSMLVLVETEVKLTKRHSAEMLAKGMGVGG